MGRLTLHIFLVILVLNLKSESVGTEDSKWRARSLEEQLQYQDCFFQTLDEWKAKSDRLPPQEHLDFMNQECLKSIEETSHHHSSTTSKDSPEIMVSSPVKEHFEQCLRDGIKDSDDMPKWPLSNKHKDLIEKCSLDIERGMGSDDPDIHTSEYQPPPKRTVPTVMIPSEPEFNEMMTSRQATKTVHHREQAETADSLAADSMLACFQEKRRDTASELPLTHDQVRFLLRQCHDEVKIDSHSSSYDESLDFEGSSRSANCPLPPKIPNGKAQVFGTGQNAIAHYRCKKGLYHSVQKFLHCGEDGQWQGNIPTCLVTASATHTTSVYLLTVVVVCIIYLSIKFIH